MPPGPREQPSRNPAKLKEFEKALTDLEFDESQIDRIFKTLAAILLLGEIEFAKADDGKAGLAGNDIGNKGNHFSA